MANWSDLKAAVASIVKTNGNKEITGQLLQNVLNNIISNIGQNSTFVGIATPETNPGTPDGNVFYLATTAGTYSNFNGIIIEAGEAVILEWKGSWTKKTSGFATQEKLFELGSEIGLKYDSEILEKNGFYNVSEISVGDYMVSSVTSSTTKCYGIIKILGGSLVNLKTYLTSNTAGAVRPYVVCSLDNKVTQIAPSLNEYDYVGGVDIIVDEDSMLYVACNVDRKDDFLIEIKKEGSIKSQIENIDTKIAQIENITKKELGGVKIYKDSDAVKSSYYYNLYGVEIGEKYEGEKKTSPNSTYYTLEVEVKKGYKIKITTYTNSNVAGYVRGYCLTNIDGYVVSIGEELNVNDYLDGKDLTSDIDGTLYVTCMSGYGSMFKVEIFDAQGELWQKVNDLDSVINSNSQDVSFNTKMFGLYLKNKNVIINGASFVDGNGFFELTMKRLGLNGTNESVAGSNIFKLANNLYINPSYYTQYDVLIIAHVHNYDVFDLPESVKHYTPYQYENDSEIGKFIKTTTYTSQKGGFGSLVYNDGELYAIGYDYCIKKYTELCYNLKNQEGYDTLMGKPVQIILYTHWHDARVCYNNSVRKLAKRWGIPLVTEDENIGFSKDRVHPITEAQQSILYCNGVPWGAKTEVIDGITYGFHPSGIASENWSSFVGSDEQGMVDMLPYIQIKRAAILVDAFSNKF